MSEQEDTQRSRRHYHQSEEKQIREQGGRELASKPAGENARRQPEEQRENRERMGVNEEHKTRKMEKAKRGTYP